MTKAEYERLKAEAKARYEADLHAIERVWNLARSGKEGASKPTPTAPSIPPTSAPSNTLVSPPADQGGSNGVSTPSEDTESRGAKSKRGSVDRAVREVLEHYISDSDFTFSTVIAKSKDHLNVVLNRSSVSGALKRLARENKLKVVREGVGRKPATYRKLSN